MLNSLRAKIAFGYALVGVLVIGMAMLALLELHLVREKVRAGAAVAEFLEVTLEIRRFEKNAFLYGQAGDLAEQRTWIGRARQLIDQHADTLREFAGGGLPELIASVDRYQQAMADYAALLDQPERRHGLEPRIRQEGKRLADFAENAARRERALVEASLEKHQRNVLLSIGLLLLLIVPVGLIVVRRIARPLKRFESHMEDIARGAREPLRLDSADREMVSLNRALDHMLAELELRQKHLLRSEKLASLGTLLSGVAHELNNPLSNISTTAQILLEDLDELPAERRRMMIGQIDEQTERARRIVRALLDFARDRPLHPAAFALHELVLQTLDFLKGIIPPTLRLNLDVAPELAVHGDRQRLQQVLLNLIQNAVEAMNGVGQLDIAARRSAMLLTRHAPAQPRLGETPQPGVEIEVADSGPGIPPDILPRVFDPFFTTKDVGRGSGLGLFVAYEIIEEHGGRLSVDSAPGRGTVFRILLPDPPENPA